MAAVQWGRLYAEAKRKNRLLSLEDSLLEATALNYGLTVATRNAKDFFRVTTVEILGATEPGTANRR